MKGAIEVQNDHYKRKGPFQKRIAAFYHILLLKTFWVIANGDFFVDLQIQSHIGDGLIEKKMSRRREGNMK